MLIKAPPDEIAQLPPATSLAPRRVPALPGPRQSFAITDADGAMADLGQRVKALYPGAATTRADVAAIRASMEWRRRPWWRRIFRTEPGR